MKILLSWITWFTAVGEKQKSRAKYSYKSFICPYSTVYKSKQNFDKCIKFYWNNTKDKRDNKKRKQVLKPWPFVPKTICFYTTRHWVRNLLNSFSSELSCVLATHIVRLRVTPWWRGGIKQREILTFYGARFRVGFRIPMTKLPPVVTSKREQLPVSWSQKPNINNECKTGNTWYFTLAQTPGFKVSANLSRLQNARLHTTHELRGLLGSRICLASSRRNGFYQTWRQPPPLQEERRNCLSK